MRRLSRTMMLASLAVVTALLLQTGEFWWTELAFAGGIVPIMAPSVAAAPPNDNFAAAIDVGTLPAHLTVNNTDATMEEEIGEKQNSGCGAWGKTVWYTMTRPTTRPVTISTLDSAVDTVVSVYIGSSLPTLTRVACNNDSSFQNDRAKLTFLAMAGTAYSIQVASNRGMEVGGNLVIDVTEAPPPTNNAFSSAIDLGGSDGTILTTTNFFASTEPGEPTSTPCGAIGKTLWYRIVRPTHASVTVATSTTNFDTLIAVYTGPDLSSLTPFVCNNDYLPGSLTSDVEFLSEPNVSYWVQVGGVAGASGDFTLGTHIEQRPPWAAMTISRPGDGEGAVRGVSHSFFCPEQCGPVFDVGTTVELEAMPTAGSNFQGWGGACAGTAMRCNVQMDAAKSVTATFNLFLVRLNVTTAGAGTGTITSTPAGVNCSSSCQAVLTRGTTVTLNAAPTPGSAFAGWGGACSGVGACVVSLDAAKSVVATFERAKVGVQLGRPAGSGAPLTATLNGRASCGPIQQIQFGTVGQPFANAAVSITGPVAGPANQTTGFVYGPPSGATTVTLSIARVLPSSGATVSPIVLRDGCGEWRTFVGGGADAFR